jgi:uncharacterized protein (TIGR02996 family)
MARGKTKKPTAVEQALALYRQGQLEELLDVLLARWRQTRSSDLADVIDHLDRRLGNDAQAVDGKNRDQIKERWYEVEAEGRAADLGHLIAAVPRVRCKDARDMLATLLAWQADPRFGRLVQLALAPPHGYQGSGSGGFWQRLATLLGRTADPRTLPDMERIIKSTKAGESDWSNLAFFLENNLERAIKTTRKTADKAKPLDEAEVAACAELKKELAGPELDKRTVDELYAAVYEQPSELDLRLVLADALQEVGDPRGELIVLQCKQLAGEGLSASEKRRVSQLLKERGKSWMGPLAPVTLKTGVTFRGGFLAECKLSCHLERLAFEALDCVQWATVESLAIHEWPESALLGLPSDAMRSLKLVEYIGVPYGPSSATLKTLREAFEALPSKPQFVKRRRR